ncbi:MAG: CDP-diacylglycerol--glycerol-3-phosphate 3-phosphatidyltransferase [Planctomycetes bacterium]|nr:CDP-diacylglycerol--glycerol-3-phosphate 3-phosphatidyltransferase [Planctomycetota bacterium]
MGRRHLPNIITLARIILSPFFILFFCLGGDWLFAAFFVGLLFEITDFLDGLIARSTNRVTGFGKIFDPLADSISRFTVFLCLLWGGYANVFAIAIIFYRDALVASVRTVAAYENVIVAARFSGKLKAVVQSIGITTVLLVVMWHRHDADPQAASSGITGVIIWFVAVVTGASGVDYIKANWHLIKRFASR